MRDTPLGRRLHELREEHDWTQEEAAKKAGISRTAYNYLETGRSERARIKTIRQLAKAFGADVDELISLALESSHPLGDPLHGPPFDTWLRERDSLDVWMPMDEYRRRVASLDPFDLSDELIKLSRQMGSEEARIENLIADWWSAVPPEQRRLTSSKTLCAQTESRLKDQLYMAGGLKTDALKRLEASRISENSERFSQDEIADAFQELNASGA